MKKIFNFFKNIVYSVIILFCFIGIGVCIFNFYYDFNERYDKAKEDKHRASLAMQLKLHEFTVCEHPELDNYLDGEYTHCKRAKRVLNENILYMALKESFDNLIEYLNPVFLLLKYIIWVGITLIIFAIIILMYKYIISTSITISSPNNRSGNKGIGFEMFKSLFKDFSFVPRNNNNGNTGKIRIKKDEF